MAFTNFIDKPVGEALQARQFLQEREEYLKPAFLALTLALLLTTESTNGVFELAHPPIEELAEFSLFLIGDSFSGSPVFTSASTLVFSLVISKNLLGSSGMFAGEAQETAALGGQTAGKAKAMEVEES